MSEDGNKVKRLKPEEREQQGEQQMMMVVPIPVEIFGEIVEALEELPRKRTKLLWNHIQQMQPQQVPMA